MQMIRVWGLTDVGLVRKENQDAYHFCQTDKHTICVVCDGMGGTAGGQIASKIAVETFTAEVSKVLSENMSPEQVREASSFAVSLANKAIREAAAKDEAYQNMGTTLVSAVICEDKVVVSNVGDSRAYHISESGIVRITKDHSLVESMVERGDITAEEARHHPNRNLITLALGPDSGALCDGYIHAFTEGEYVLLCTDGLVDTVTDQEMLFEVIHGGTPETCLDRLFEIAKKQGARDNVTAVLVQKI
jgi:protein phosphatase